MYQKSLEWAERLRADLVVRIEGLEAALADVEPLRQELERLRAQVKGVERMITICRGHLGYPQPSWADEGLAASVRQLESSFAPVEGARGGAHDMSLIPPRAYNPLMPESTPRKEPIFDAAAYKKSAVAYAKIAGKALFEIKLWFVKQFLRRSAAP
jgi:hypothetical protein